MAAPTATEVRDLLEGYGVTVTVLTDAWINARRDNNVIPTVKQITRLNFDSIATVTEPYSGNGGNELILNRRPIVLVTNVRYVNSASSININNFVVLQAEGKIRTISNVQDDFSTPLFPKGKDNILVTYTYGYEDYPADVKEAVMYLTAIICLTLLANRTGGGGLSGEGWSRDFGERGKYDNLRTELSRHAMLLLSKYMTGVIGG